MRDTIDPRAWNILAGLCLVSSCGDRTIGVDDDGTESNTQRGTLETGGPESVNDQDCTPGYYCIDGSCEYIPVSDGHWYSECYSDADCQSLALCDYNYCLPLPEPDGCAYPLPSWEIPAAALSLSFVDVDADGADELVIATASELMVYESGSDVPTVSPRELESDSIDAMVGGPFDAMPGDDVVILVADELRLHGSDGMGSFAAPSVSASPWPDSVGLIAGEFDGAAPADLLIWAHAGAGVSLGSGAMIELSTDDIDTASARPFAAPVAGFVLEHDGLLDLFTIAGSHIDSAQTHLDAPHGLTSIEQLGDSLDLSSSVVAQDWTLLQSWGPATGNEGASWGVQGRATQIVGGDFDGGGRADVALLQEDAVEILAGVLDDPCLMTYPFADLTRGLAVGDHDGDGDDELAIWFEAGHVAVADGE